MNYLAGLLAPFVMFGAYIGSVIAPEPELGASEAIPTTIAFFETTLAGAITDSATSFTLTSATDKDGTVLASSTYAFVIDEGSSNEEIVIADCTGTTCTNALRGVSARTGNTEVAALKKAHRRGASVKITDAPILMLVSRILRGEQGVDFTPDANSDLVTKTYVDSLALGTTTVSASVSDDGLVELATGTEAASSTATGNSGSPLALHTGISTSTAPTTGSYVVVTRADGNIDDGFLGGTASTTDLKIGDTPILSIGRYFWSSTTAGTSTWSVPTGVKKIKVTITGGGGGGGSCSAGSSNLSAGGGGGAGGTVISYYNVSATTSIQFVIGAGGAATANGGESYFAGTLIAGGGLPGGSESSGGGQGLASGGDINIRGGGGGTGSVEGANTSNQGGVGGSSYWGGGAEGPTNGDNGGSASVYGAGGAGASCNNSDSSTGGAGKNGMLLIEY